MSERPSVWWLGVFMVLAGALWFLDSSGIVEIDPLWAAALFAAAGLGLGYVGLTDRHAWWMTIPAGTLVGIAAVVAWNRLTSMPSEWGAGLLLFCMGAGFWLLLLTDRSRWWAIIPGGILISIGAFVGLTTVMPDLQAVGMLLFGFAATFALVAAVPTDRGRMWWALVPAAILALIASLFAIQVAPLFEPLDDFVLPLVLLLAGIVVLWRVGTQRHPGPRP